MPRIERNRRPCHPPPRKGRFMPSDGNPASKEAGNRSFVQFPNIHIGTEAALWDTASAPKRSALMRMAAPRFSELFDRDYLLEDCAGVKKT